MREDIEDWIALNLVPGLGARTARLLVAQWPKPAAIFAARAQELARAGAGAEAIESLRAGDTRASAEELKRKLDEIEARAITLFDEDYPRLLREIHDPPLVLYVRGELKRACAQPAIAVVGSRRASTYGRNAAEMLAGELATRGITIVSGLARGIDTCAHRAALQAGGMTVAVMASGLDIIYPKENAPLAQEIVKQGALVTELPPATPPLARHFPFRNRIISGLCQGVLVVEAAERSGSLITARLALEQNREVFAVPGQISSAGSFGPNYLIKDGAKLVQNWRDIVEELPGGHAVASTQQPAQQQELFPPAQLSETERRIYDLLDRDTPVNIEELSSASGLGPGQLASALLTLEVKDKIRQLPGKQFVKIS